jgi:hypothetical protein
MYRKRMAKDLDEFYFCRLDKHFYPLCKILYFMCNRYGNTGGLQKKGTQNRSENVRSMGRLVAPPHSY